MDIRPIVRHLSPKSNDKNVIIETFSTHKPLTSDRLQTITSLKHEVNYCNITKRIRYGGLRADCTRFWDQSI